MIFQILIVIILGLINAIFSILPSIPNVPTELSNAISSFFDLLFSNSGLVGFFVPMNIVKIALPIAIIISQFDHIYKMALWVIKKLPFNIN